MSKKKHPAKPNPASRGLPQDQWAGIQVKRFDPRKVGLERWFGPLEAAVMEVIWSNPSRKPVVKFILRQLHLSYGNGEIGYTTVMTTMVRLYKRGILQRKRQGMPYIYWPTSSEEEFIDIQVNAIRQSLVDNGDIEP